MSNVICITGATSGLGRAAARLFIDNGWRVVGTGRRRERLEKMRGELGVHFFGLCFDIQSREETKAAFDGLPEDFSAVDVLFNNAGLFAGDGRVQDGDTEAWETMMNTNILGLLYCTRLLLPGMLARGRGHVVNVGSVAGSRAFPTGNVYGASKAFVRHLSDNMRADLLGTPVRVTCIAPGRTRTEFSLVHNAGNAEKAEKEYATGRPLDPEDIARALLWVVECPVHMDVSYMELMPTGQADGGPRFSDVTFPSDEA